MTSNVTSRKNPGSKDDGSEQRRWNLTFQPAIDDRDELRAFLQTVIDRYETMNGPTISSPDHPRMLPDDVSERNRTTATRACYNLAPADTDEAFAANVASSSNLRKAPPETKEAVSKAAKLRRRRKRLHSSSSSLVGTKPHGRVPVQLDGEIPTITKRVRASEIDIYAPDPEQDSPPGETEDEKRKRRERINGRRKRAKKFIEIDQMHMQVSELVERNEKLRTENQAFRERLVLVKEVIEKGRSLTKELLCLPQSSVVGASAEENVSLMDQKVAAKREPDESAKVATNAPTLPVNPGATLSATTCARPLLLSTNHNPPRNPLTFVNPSWNQNSQVFTDPTQFQNTHLRNESIASLPMQLQSSLQQQPATNHDLLSLLSQSVPATSQSAGIEALWPYNNSQPQDLAASLSSDILQRLAGCQFPAADVYQPFRLQHFAESNVQRLQQEGPNLAAAYPHASTTPLAQLLLNNVLTEAVRQQQVPSHSSQPPVAASRMEQLYALIARQLEEKEKQLQNQYNRHHNQK